VETGLGGWAGRIRTCKRRAYALPSAWCYNNRVRQKEPQTVCSCFYPVRVLILLQPADRDATKLVIPHASPGMMRIAAGTAPADPTVSGLFKALPYCWAEQETRIGLVRALQQTRTLRLSAVAARVAPG
jgi:hypothetical protein